MDRRAALLVAAGGTVGAIVRWAIGAAADHGAFPWPTLLVNLAGCALLGAALRTRRDDVRHLVGVGFCGGLTTFSTFSVELAGLLRDDRTGIAVGYLAASVAGGVAAALAGARVRGETT